MIGPASSSLTPSGILVVYLPSAIAYCWKVPAAVKPAFFCLGQCSSLVPLKQNSHSPQVDQTHLMPARSPTFHFSCMLSPTATTIPAPSCPAMPFVSACISTPNAAHSSWMRLLSEAHRPVLLSVRSCKNELGLAVPVDSDKNLRRTWHVHWNLLDRCCRVVALANAYSSSVLLWNINGSHIDVVSCDILDM